MTGFFMLRGKKILIGVTASIAAYKSAVLIRLLVKQGAEVKVIMTPSAQEFITPLTLSTLSKNEVLTGFATDHTWSNHVMLGRWADVMLIAPLSCNTLAKLANGLCDNLLTAVYLSSTCPVVIAPAMDEDMWKHPSTQHNLQKVMSFGNKVIPVASGELASGLTGEGRMAEPEEIVDWLNRFFLTGSQYTGKKILVTAGPTYEAIDPVRFIGNHSSGKMGVQIAQAFVERGAEVTLVTGPMHERVIESITAIKVRSAEEMFQACEAVYETMDIIVMAAAVADYTPVEVADQKIKKTDDEFTVTLKRTKDVLGFLGANKKPGQLLVGFALETQNEKENAIQKLKKKNADLIVLNSLKDEGAGFGSDTNKITIFDKAGKEYAFDLKPKAEVAVDIVNTIYQKIHE